MIDFLVKLIDAIFILFLIFSFFFVAIRTIKSFHMERRLKTLEHFKDEVIGLRATDRPDLIPKEVEQFFWEITDDC